MGSSTIIYFVIALVIAFICMNVAKGKGHSPALWFVLGLVFPIIALVIILVLGPAQGSGGRA